ncbi:MAG: hypothetical protein KDD89_03955, partial [Anaerolineales bacterium]|nr:hypothetical protein [Anaerolineales bacterium]
ESGITSTAVLDPGTSEAFALVVTVPLTATDGLTATTTLTAVSALDPAVSASQTVTTTAVVVIVPPETYEIYLPAVVRP